MVLEEIRHKCIIITPLDVAGQKINASITGIVKKIGIKVYEIPNVSSGASLANAITEAIAKADFVVADITRQNPNVLFEVGYAHALGKPLVLLVDIQAKSNLPTDLTGFTYHLYDSIDNSSFKNMIIAAVIRVTGRMKS